jgi:ankyrin repeat protein
MKQILSIIFSLAVLSLGAQTNVLLDAAFWKENPDVAAVKAAVEKGNNPAEFNRSSFDPVVLAINNRAPIETIKYLLDQKGNTVDKLTHDGRTYVFWAASSGNVDLVNYLLDKGSKIDMLDSHGATPITFSIGAAAKNTAVFDAFVKHGADLKKVTNQDGANLIMLGIPQDKDMVLTNYLLAKGLDMKSTDKEGNTVFNYVARTGDIELMKSLLQKGVKPTDNAMLMASQGSGPRVAPQQAPGGQQAAPPAGGRGGGPTAGNPLEVYQYLESLKIKPTVKSKNGENALHFIARRPNQAAIITWFLSKGVDINQPDNDGNTPFMYAAMSNRDTGTLALLKPKVKNINQVNAKGTSALAMAVASNSPAVVQFLLQNGADVKQVDAAGDNLAVYLLQSYSPMRGTEDFESKLAILKNAGLDVSAPQKNGNTLYHVAITRSDLELLKRIEKMNVDVNAKNKEGLTVLHKAAMTAKNDTILKYLLSLGARKDITTEFKETVYDLASENEFLVKNKMSIDFLK